MSSLSKATVSSSDGEAEPQSKRPRPARAASKQSAAEKSGLERNAEGDAFLSLSAKRRLTVRKWKTSILVDVREYYEGGGNELLPGKKGISLSLEQWEQLRDSMSAIDAAIAALK